MIAVQISTTKVDLESIRAIGREILGNRAGATIDCDDLPKSMSDWMRFPSKSNAKEDFKNWQDVLIKSFGERKFVKFEINRSIIYGNKE